MSIEGASNAEVAQGYAREFLAPAPRPGKIVVMDKPGARKNNPTTRPYQPSWCRGPFPSCLFPVPCPIEMMWSKLKALLRKEQARNHPDLLKAAASALSCVTAQDALDCFAARAYSFISHTIKDAVIETLVKKNKT